MKLRVIGSWYLELHMRRGRKVYTQVHTVNSNSRTANCQCSLFSKKNPIIQIFCLSGWLAAPINPDKCSSDVYNLYQLQSCTKPRPYGSRNANS